MDRREIWREHYWPLIVSVLRIQDGGRRNFKYWKVANEFAGIANCYVLLNFRYYSRSLKL